MSVEFGPIPMPQSPIEDYFERGLDPYRDSLAPSPTSHLAAADRRNRTTLTDALTELSEKQAIQVSMESMESNDNDSLLESQPIPSASAPPEYSVPLAKKLTFLALYFVVNLGLTLSNKAILQKINTPWLLTVMHAAGTSVGCAALAATGHLKLSHLGAKENLILVAFSSLFTLNIAISNVSLAMVSVPFHQVARSTCPVVTVLIYRTVFNRSYDRQTYLSLLPLIIGVGLATLGDYDVTILGIVFTALGVVLAATKSIVTNRLMTGPLALSPLETLFRMSPLAAMQCLLYAYISGEFSKFQSIGEADIGGPLLVMILGNAAGAFLLNTVSFTTNKLTGALTMSVCGNLKQCLTIVLGIAVFNVNVTLLNAVGIGIALGGAALYSRAEMQRKRER